MYSLTLPEFENAWLPQRYAFLNGDVPHISDLQPGTYVVRGSQRDLSHLGYQQLSDTVTLERADTDVSRPGKPAQILQYEPLEASPSLPIQLHHICQFSANRLFWTLPAGQADLLMSLWIRNCFGGRAERVGVHVDQDGHADGFLAIRRVNAKTEAIDLIGVAPESRGHGIGGRLVLWGLATSEAERMVVRTEASNAPALAMYQRRGFSVTATEPQWWAEVKP